jgi:dTDP-4-dehydrorhamnose 3,5-epimerase
LSVFFEPVGLDGACVISLERHEDERGFFARSFCSREFSEHGLNPNVAQCNVSFNPHLGTLRGMHFQAAPHEEAKVVRCIAGAIYDVIVDLREGSRSFLRHFGVRLAAQERLMLYVPEGFAHGFITLEAGSEVLYQMSQFYQPEASRGVRWDDPALNIAWPIQPRLMSDRDRSYPDFQIFNGAGRGPA